MYRATLEHPADLDGFRKAARTALARGIAPEALDWAIAGDASGLDLASPLPPLPDAPAPRVPRH